MRFIHIKSIPLDGKMIGPDLGIFLDGLLKWCATKINKGVGEDEDANHGEEKRYFKTNK